MAANSEICDARRQNYKDIDEIRDVALGDSDEDIDLGEENSDYNDDNDWEYEAEHPQPTVTFVADPQSDIMVDNDNNADVREPTAVEQPIPASVMIPEHNTDTDKLLDAGTSGGDDEPLPKCGQGGIIRCGQGQHVHTCDGCRGSGIHTRDGRGSVANGKATQGDNPNWTWKKINQTQNNVDTETIPIFSKNEGLHVRIGDTPNALDLVELYLTDEILTCVFNETNLYAHQYLEENPEKADTTYLSACADTDNLEMKKFFGLVILMGIIHKPNLPMYWSTDSLYHTPIFSKIMTRDQFYLLQKFLQFNDAADPNYNPNDDERDHLHKVRLFMEMIREWCCKVYYSEKQLSVDESLVLFKGRLHVKQYIKTKRARFGIKLYELTSSDGITLDFLVYCG